MSRLSQGLLIVLFLSRSLISCAVHVVSAEAACCLTRVTSRRLLLHWLIPNSVWEWCREQRWDL